MRNPGTTMVLFALAAGLMVAAPLLAIDVQTGKPAAPQKQPAPPVEQPAEPAQPPAKPAAEAEAKPPAAKKAEAADANATPATVDEAEAAADGKAPTRFIPTTKSKADNSATFPIDI